MGSFANQLFTLMLGWIQSTCAAVWQAFTAPAQQPALIWLQKHWMTAALVLCVLGALADLTVYFFRWHPLDVWSSFFRRLRERADKDSENSELLSTGETADSSDEEETAGMSETGSRLARLRMEEENAQTRLEKAEESLLKSRRRRFAGRYYTGEGEYAGNSVTPQEIFNTQDTYHQPVYPRKWRSNDRNEENAE